MRCRFSDGWIVFAAVIVLVAVASLTVASVTARSNGCIFDDGAAYCRMAMGKLAQVPWSHRVGVPAVVSWLPGGWSVVVRFQLVALLAASGATIATGLLALRLLRDRAAPRVVHTAAIAAAALVALSPHLFRLGLTAPVLVDQAAIFVGLVWCLLVTARSRPLRFASPLVVLLLVLTRETWVLPVLLVTGLLWWMRDRALAAATLLATLAACAFTYTRPSAPGRFHTILKILHDGRVALTHPDQAVWLVFFGMGFAAFLAVLLLVRRQSLRGPVGIVLAITCGQLVQAPLSGTDSRYAAAVLPFAIVLAIVAVVDVANPRAFWALVGLSAATILLWQPFRVTSPGVGPYKSMYYPGAASALIALGGLVLVAATLIWVRRGSRATLASTAGTVPKPLAHPASDA